MKKKEILDVIEKDVLEKSQMEKEEERQDKEEEEVVTVPEESKTPMNEIYDEDNKVPEEVTVDEDKQELMDIEDIKGVGSVTAAKLREMGIENIADLAFASAIDIHEKIATTRNTYDFCQNLVVYANKYLHESGIMDKAIVSSSKLLKDEVTRKRFSTGDEMYDKWLGGGFESKAVTELYGRFKSGKTQTCDCVAITTAARGENVLFIDTENSYSPTRINEIAKHKKLDTDKVQDNIKVLKTQSASMLGINIQELSRHIREHDIKLVIVDSIIALHRAEFIGRGNLSTRQGQLSKIMMYLVKAAEHHDIGVIITNQVLESPDPFKHGEFPTGGNVIGHCLNIDTKVVTTSGIKSIKDVNEGEMIFNGSKFVKILGKSDIKEKECVEIRSNNFITSSLEHRFPIYNKNGNFIKDECSKNLLIDNNLSIPDRLDLPIEEVEIPTDIQPSKTIKLKNIICNEVKQSLKGRFKNNKELEKESGITIRQLRRVINEQYPTMIESGNGLVQYSLNRQLQESDYELFQTYKHQNIIIPEFINEPILRLYGAWLCDADKNDNMSIRIRKHSDQIDYLRYLGELCKKEFNISKYKISKIRDKNCYQLSINSRELVKVLKNIDIDKLVLLNKDKILEFCASLIDGDGSILDNHISFSQVDFELVNKLQILLLRLGIQSVIRRFKNSSEWKKSEFTYDVGIIGTSGKRLLVDSMKNIKKKNNFDSQKMRNYSPILTTPIKDIINIGKKQVIDIEVEGSYFFCNGVITHNSSTHRIYLRGKGQSNAASNTKSYSTIIMEDSPRYPRTELMIELGPYGVRGIDPSKPLPKD